MTENSMNFWAQVAGTAIGAVITVLAAWVVTSRDLSAQRLQRTLDAQDLGLGLVDGLTDFTDHMSDAVAALAEAQDFDDGDRTPRMSSEAGIRYGRAHEQASQRLNSAQGFVSQVVGGAAAGMGRNRSALVQRLRVELESLRSDLQSATLSSSSLSQPLPRFFDNDDGPQKLRTRWATIQVLLLEIAKLHPEPLRQVLPR